MSWSTSENSAPSISIWDSGDQCIDGLVQDCGIFSALAMEILQSCTKPSVWHMDIYNDWLVFMINEGCSDSKICIPCYWLIDLCSDTMAIVRQIIMTTSSYGNFSALLTLCVGNLPWQCCGVTWSFGISLICSSTNGWANNRGAADLRHHRTHYIVTVMIMESCPTEDVHRVQGPQGCCVCANEVYI